jgi:hypothetical protein
MKLARLFAFEIYPQKGIAEPSRPVGGRIVPNDRIKNTLGQIDMDARLDKATSIAFHVQNPKTDKYQNAMRNRVLDFCFYSAKKSQVASEEMALSLSRAMDNRSKPLLLLVSSFELANNRRRVVIWAFPKDEAFKFSATKQGATVEFVPDVFSVSSQLRKAAVFEGTKSNDSFWEGRMLDLQSGTTDLWIKDFLQSRLSVGGHQGTARMVDTIAEFYKSAIDDESREQVFNAIVAVRTSPVRRMSLARFAKDYLSNDVKVNFLASVASEDRNVTFDFDRALFETKLGFKLFKMKDDVYVSAPIGLVGTTVKISNSKLSYKGEIVEEKLRSIHGR